METIAEWITLHASTAHWYVFIAILLAGLNIPISIDMVIIICAFLAAQIIPEMKFHLFFSIFIGCIFSAWIAYGVGRFIGTKFQNTRLFAKFLHPERLQKAKNFYDRYGFFALLIGRFIPFGVRNCIFMSTGMSKVSFKNFILRDFFACFIWISAVFYTFFKLGENYQVLWQYMKTFNLVIILSLAVAGIAVFWYKKKKNKIRTLPISE